QTENESEQKCVCRNVQIKIKSRMDDVGRDCGKRADLQCEIIAQDARRDSDAFRPEPLVVLPTFAQMCAEEKQETEGAEDSVLSQQMQIIVMHVHRITVDRCASELPPVK